MNVYGKFNRIKITKLGGERALGWSAAAGEASLLSPEDGGQCGNVLSLTSDVPQTRRRIWLYPRAFSRWTLKQVQKKNDKPLK